MKRPLVIAHRGFSSAAPENSAVAIRRAVAARADMIELDIRLSGDGVPVVSHDADLLRLVGRSIAIADTDAATLGSIRRPDGTPGAARLAELLPLIGSLGVMFDIKVDTDAALAALLAAADRAGLGERAVYGVRSSAAAERLARLRPQTRRLALFADPDAYARFLAEDGVAFRLWEDDATPARIDAIHQAGGAVWITAGRPGDTARQAGEIGDAALSGLAARGVDGVLVNDPAAALSILETRALRGA
jgi:glycerophosphoryl diester phosphodiesterase